MEPALTQELVVALVGANYRIRVANGLYRITLNQEGSSSLDLEVTDKQLTLLYRAVGDALFKFGPQQTQRDAP